jgi:hypothetical protein
MKGRVSAVVTGLLLGLAAFCLYGGGRTTCETVGVNLKSLLVGSFFGICLPGLLILALFPVLRPVLVRFNWCWLWIAVLPGLAIGSALSECWILYDEGRFSLEARDAAPTAVFRRARAWPNQASSLVYSPENGIRATD